MRRGDLTTDYSPTSETEPIRFPSVDRHRLVDAETNLRFDSSFGEDGEDQFDQLFRTIDSTSRRIDDLARQLNCLGFFNSDDDDRPRAA